LLGLVVKIFVLNKIAEPFSGAYEAGVVAEAVLASIVASYVFYLLVVHLSQIKDREQIEPFVKKHLTRMVGDAYAVLADISKTSGTQLSLASLTAEDLHNALSKIQVGSESPLLISPQMRKASWIEFFSYRASRTKTSAQKLLHHVTLISAKRIRLIVDIDDCSYFNQLEQMTGVNIRADSDLTFIGSGQFKYFQLCQELRTLEQME